MIHRTIIGWAIVAFGLLPLPVWAVEYRLQVTNIDRLIFSSYLDRAGASPRGQETMRLLETSLDTMEFSPSAVLPGRRTATVSFIDAYSTRPAVCSPVTAVSNGHVCRGRNCRSRATTR